MKKLPGLSEKETEEFRRLMSMKLSDLTEAGFSRIKRLNNKILKNIEKSDG